MSKKYQHQPKPQKGALELSINRLSKENQALRTENETLQTALRLLTSADKQDLLKAVKQVEDVRVFNGAWIQAHTHATGASYVGLDASTLVISK